MTKSELAFMVAARAPGLAKLALWTWARIAMLASMPSWADHWVMEEISESLAYRIPVWTRLGNGLKVRVALNDTIGRQICEDGYYEPQTVRLMEQLIGEGMVVLDVGAHIGQYTLVASRLVTARGHVHSFEPDPETSTWLQMNVSANCLRNVTVNQIAVAADQEPKRLYFSKIRDTGCNSLVEPRDFQRSGRWCEVACTTLDAYADGKGISRIDLIKADVEGAELAMLQGARKILGASTPPLLLMEFEEERQRASGSSCVRLAEELRGYGYALWKVGNHLEPYDPAPGDPPSLNILAVHPSRQVQISKLPGIRPLS